MNIYLYNQDVYLPNSSFPKKKLKLAIMVGTINKPIRNALFLTMKMLKGMKNKGIKKNVTNDIMSLSKLFTAMAWNIK